MEEDRLWPGAVFAALAECRRHLEQPGRVLPDPVMGCECGDPLVARDVLEDVLLWLPRGARADLGGLVSRLDAEFDRRTVPLSAHLMLASPSGACGRWRQRLLDDRAMGIGLGEAGNPGKPLSAGAAHRHAADAHA
ncbi:hypothetical protein ACF05L_06335 [Streptomyces bobili]|uniref:hypothetical protein n=1 Tax=Streptomyces bobili TaxID=67280 RepID=UPI0036FBF750